MMSRSKLSHNDYVAFKTHDVAKGILYRGGDAIIEIAN